ncbi:MAG: DNA polymerase I [Alphaproteobacteria bacterium]|nr:DNA polymerase I [Alphaproteobacteria bacterium]
MTDSYTICLVDGSGYIFRAFYALPPMTRGDGTPINAVYGYVNMLMNLIKENACEHIVVVFDAKRKNFRNDIFTAYKENRKETPPELVPQFPLIRAATEAFNIPWIEMEGYEADDLIATYARIATEKGWHTRIISGDKDLMQLMTPTVSLYDPLKRKQLTNEDVIAKFGVGPDKVIDVQSLMGDSTDNIPGANGIGPKTAAELINTFGSLENLLDNLEKIPQPKRREGLIRDKDQVLMSQKLVSLDKYAPVNENLSVFEVKQPNYETIVSFLSQNDFKSLIDKTKAWAATQGYRIEGNSENKPIQAQYECIQTIDELKKWIDNIKKHKAVAIDTETNSLNPFEADLVGFSLSYEIGKACYVPLRHGGEETGEQADLFNFSATSRPKQIPVKTAMDLLKPILEDDHILKIGHNIKYDMHILSREIGANFKIAPIQDTMLMSYALNGTKHGHGMDELAATYLNHTTIKYRDICGTGRAQITFDQAELEGATKYAAEDADITLRLYQVFEPQLTHSEEDNILKKFDLPLIQILFDMERCGIMIDKDQLNRLNVYFDTQLADLTHKIYELAGEEFNINSPAQLGVILFEKMGASGGKKGSNGAWKTDIKILEKLSENGNELAQKVIDYRSFSKLKSTYVDALLTLLYPNHKRVHTSFSLTSTSTGRLASSDPNLQNIPIRSEAGKEIRQAFIAKEGYKLICADYSQIELRLMADVADVKLLRQALINNEDIHALTASQVFGIPLNEIDADTRRRAKAINFGIVYGISAFGLSNQLGISRSEAKQYIDAYFDKYPEIKTYMDKTIAFAHEHEYVETPFGRKCYVYGINDKGLRSFAERAAINAPIQGGAADIIKLAMKKVVRELTQSHLDASLLLQVHDELIFEVADSDVEQASTLIKNAMETVVDLSVPLIVEVGVGNNWKEAH